jgi:acyl carrier protein
MTRGEFPSRGEIEGWLIREMAETLEVPEADIDPDQNFFELGIGSRRIVAMSGRLKKWLHIDLPPTLLFEYATVRELSDYLAARGRGPEPPAARLRGQ